MSGRQAHKWKQQKLDDEQKLLDQRYEDYRKERELLVNLEQNVYDGYEKTILTLSASFLAFSVSFLGIMKSKVNPGHTPVPILATIVLYRAWISFASSVFMMILNFLFSAIGMRAAIVDIENSLEDKTTKRAMIWTRLTMTINVLAGIAFLVGVILLIRFCAVNLWAL